MMRHLLILIVLHPLLVYSQTEVEFETVFYFEDAVGHRDTAVVGIDSTVDGSWMAVNEALGEKDLSGIPYDEEFEVRGVRMTRFSPDSPITQSKKIYAHTERYSNSWDCSAQANVLAFLIRSKNLPVKISWSKAKFNQSVCRVSSVLCPHDLSNVWPFWYQDSTARSLCACLGETDSLYVENFNYDLWGIAHIDPIENVGVDTVWGVKLLFRSAQHPSTPCTRTVVDNQDYDEKEEIDLYPNPTYGEVRFSNQNAMFYSLYSQDGKVVKSGYDRGLDLTELPSGIYLIRYRQSKNRPFSFGRVVKL